MASAAVLPNVSVLHASPRATWPTDEPKRRKPSMQQGQALVILGHAIEYLIDSRLPEGGTTDDENQAIRLMMAASRAVFEECPAVVPFTQKVGKWLQVRTARNTETSRSLHAQLR